MLREPTKESRESRPVRLGPTRSFTLSRREGACRVASLCLLFLCRVAAGANSPDIRSLLDEANQQLTRWEVKSYEQTLRRAWQSEGAAEDRVEAGVALAHDLWRIQHKPAEARKLLATVRALKAKPAWPPLELAGLETFAGNHAAACEAARAALAVAASGQERRDARTHFGQTVCDELLQTTLRTAQTGTNAATEARIHEAFELLEPTMQYEPGWREPSRYQVLLALLVGNGPSAWRAWQSFYLLVPGQSATRLRIQAPRDFGDLANENGKGVNRPLPFTEPGEVLARLLPTFGSKADAATRAGVVRVLAGSRLFPEAAALALRWQLKPDNTLRDIIIYGRWTDNLARLLAEQYRRHALGESYRTHLHVPYLLDTYLGQSSVEKVMASESKKLWQQRHQGIDSALFNGESSAIDLRLAFGAVGRGAEDPDTFSYGHSVLVSEDTIEQYGRKKVMKCLVLDSLACNGYGDWLVGVTGAGLGGWSSPPAEFVQIRGDWSLYVWQSLTEPELYRRYIRERRERWNAEDGERAKTNACGYFPGLALRLYVRGNERLLQQLKGHGLIGLELRTAFLKERQWRLNASHILAHEGRHVLDANEKAEGYPGAELEFRAKCSEVAFAPDPLLQLGVGNIFSANIGQRGSAHGMANALVMKGLLAWLQAHAREIPALDPAQPLLPQFDRLTDEQMRAAFRSMDPWAKTL